MSGIRRAVVGLALGALTALVISGCTKPEPTAEASKWDRPAVVWDGGAAPSGGAEDSPWAKEFREAQLMKSYASARKDTSYAEYVQAFGYDAAVKDADFMKRGYNSFDDRDPETGEYVPDAPARWAAQRLLIASVTEDSDGRSAIIDYCYVIYTVGSFHEDVICAPVRLMHHDNDAVSFEFVADSELPESADPNVTSAELTVADIPTARWATPITAPTLSGEVKMPLPREYYVELGVIPE